MKIRFTSKIRTTIGRGALSVSLSPGQSVVCEFAISEAVDELLDAGNGHGRDLVKAGVITLAEVHERESVAAQPPTVPASVKPTDKVVDAPAELSDDDIAEMSVATARPIIVDADIKLLERWEAIEKAGRARVTILELIDDRLEALTKKPDED